MAVSAVEVLHCVPRCLLGFFDRAASGELDAAGFQAWFDWEEAFRYGVDPDISREMLVSLIDSSATPIPASEHRAGHSQAGDFVRWGRRGGLATLALYGRDWFVLLARRRWKKITAAQLEEAFANMSTGQL